MPDRARHAIDRDSASAISQYALRGFRRNPLFVCTVVGTIALGLGLNTALFTIFNNFVLRPLPRPRPL